MSDYKVINNILYVKKFKRLRKKVNFGFKFKRFDLKNLIIFVYSVKDLNV